MGCTYRSVSKLRVVYSGFVTNLVFVTKAYLNLAQQTNAIGV
jgi:hypothetical protein